MPTDWRHPGRRSRKRHGQHENRHDNQRRIFKFMFLRYTCSGCFAAVHEEGKNKQAQLILRGRQRTPAASGGPWVRRQNGGTTPPARAAAGGQQISRRRGGDELTICATEQLADTAGDGTRRKRRQIANSFDIVSFPCLNQSRQPNPAFPDDRKNRQKEDPPPGRLLRRNTERVVRRPCFAGRIESLAITQSYSRRFWLKPALALPH